MLPLHRIKTDDAGDHLTHLTEAFSGRLADILDTAGGESPQCKQNNNVGSASMLLSFSPMRASTSRPLAELAAVDIASIMRPNASHNLNKQALQVVKHLQHHSLVGLGSHYDRLGRRPVEPAEEPPGDNPEPLHAVIIPCHPFASRDCHR